jgi:hypothetical protein
MASRSQIAEVDELYGRIRPILRGKDQTVIGAVLAQLLANWLIGWEQMDGNRRTPRPAALWKPGQTGETD